MGKETVSCEHCGAEADLILEGFESVEDVVKRETSLVCKACGKEIFMETSPKETLGCKQCGAEADMTLEGFESVADVIQREKHVNCKACGQPLSWTDKEDLKAIRLAMDAEKDALQNYSKAAKMTKNPRGRDMFNQLSEFELNHYKRLRALLKSLQEKGEWTLYPGTTLGKPAALKAVQPPKGREQLNDMDALKLAIRAEKKAHAFYRSMVELTRDPRGRDMYRRLAEEEELHEKLLNDQYYSLHNTGIWSWGD